MIRVYMSGPITKGDREHNFTQAAAMHRLLLRAGFAVWNPILSMKLPGAFDIPHELWIKSDLPWIEKADCVLRLPGESIGADMEVEHATKCGIPVFYDYEELRQWASQKLS